MVDLKRSRKMESYWKCTMLNKLLKEKKGCQWAREDDRKKLQKKIEIDVNEAVRLKIHSRHSTFEEIAIKHPNWSIGKLCVGVFS